VGTASRLTNGRGGRLNGFVISPTASRLAAIIIIS
jgi:hypothetical protein